MHNNPNNAPDQNIKFPGVILSSSLVEIYKKNECYIREVVDGSRSLLRYVVNDLFPNDYLKHAPVRTYFRILSGAMFLLKVSQFLINSTIANITNQFPRPSPSAAKKRTSQFPSAYSTKQPELYAPASLTMCTSAFVLPISLKVSPPASATNLYAL